MGNKTCDQEELSPCWLCGGKQLSLIKPANISGSLVAENFSITDSNYGITADIYRCEMCGFLQCSKLADVSKFYQELEDTDYEESRAGRSLQQRKLLQQILPYKKTGRLLDIGAGSGTLVEQAIAMNFDAIGVEPSRFLWERAQARKLPVLSGVFPHQDLQPPYDVVTLIDIIEHVNNPLGMLQHVEKCLAKDGIGLLVTPDVGSVAAQVLRSKWWHFRIAHIGYFTKETLLLSLQKAGLKPLYTSRPKWYFKVDYLTERMGKYLPGKMKIPLPACIGNITIPLNLFDSMLIIFEKK